MSKLTLHRALTELKTIDDRIEKAIDSIEPIGSKQNDKLVNGFYKQEDFEEKAKSTYQSIIDLIERKNKLKCAIVDANAVTKVKVAGKEMTIADAINFKLLIDYEKDLLEQLKVQNQEVKSGIEKKNAQVEQNALQLAQSALQKDNVKISDNDAIAITEPYIKKNSYELVDPLKIETKIQELEEEITNFESDVDSTLSEVNAVTVIEIKD